MEGHARSAKGALVPVEQYIVTASGVRFISASRADSRKKLPSPEIIEFRIRARSKDQAVDNVACYLEWEDFVYEALSVEGPFPEPEIGPWG